jgi:hypothetical protein
MRSSARIRAAVGHGKNRDPAFDTLPSSPIPPPFHSRHFLKASTQSIPDTRNQDFECCFSTVVGVQIPSLQEKPHAHPQKGPT